MRGRTGKRFLTILLVMILFSQSVWGLADVWGMSQEEAVFHENNSLETAAGHSLEGLPEIEEDEEKNAAASASGNEISRNAVSENGISGNKISGNTVSEDEAEISGNENAISANEMLKDELSGNGLSENILSENILSENNLSENGLPGEESQAQTEEDEEVVSENQSGGIRLSAK